MPTLNISDLWSISSYISVIMMSFFVVYFSAGFHVYHGIHAWFIIKWLASLKSLASATPFFMSWLTHKQNSWKSYWCLSWASTKRMNLHRINVNLPSSNIRNAYKMPQQSPHTRDVRISTRNIFPFKLYTNYVIFCHRRPQSDLKFTKYLSNLHSI